METKSQKTHPAPKGPATNAQGVKVKTPRLGKGSDAARKAWQTRRSGR